MKNSKKKLSKVREEDSLVKATQIDDIMFYLDGKNDTATIVGCRGKSRGVVIPSEVYCYSNFYRVTHIEQEAFYRNMSLESVYMPNIPIETPTIGSGAFEECLNLQTVFLSEYVNYMGSNVFRGCIRLQTVVLPKNITEIPVYAFADCVSLHSISIPDNVTKIRDGAFWNCKNLQNVDIPESVTEIEPYAFFECTSLESVHIGRCITFDNNTFPEHTEIIYK